MESLDFSKRTFTDLSNAGHMETVITLDEKSFAGRATLIPSLDPIYVEFHKCVEHELNIFKVERSYLETQDVHDAGKERNRIFIGIGEQLRGAQRSGNKEVREAGRQIGHIYDNYKDTVYHPQNSETAEIYNFILDCRKPEMSIYLDKLPLVKADLADLEKVNIEFDNAFDTRSKKRQQSLDNGNMQEARVKTDNSYMNMQTVINALLMTDTDPDQRALLVEMVKDATAFLNEARKNHRKKKSDDGGDTPEPGPKPVLTPIVHITSQNVRNPVADPAGAAKLMTANVAEDDYEIVRKLKSKGKLKGSMLLLTPDPSVEAMKLPYYDLSDLDDEPMFFVFDRPSETQYFSFPKELYCSDKELHCHDNVTLCLEEFRCLN
jgi:hypothetical protein